MLCAPCGTPPRSKKPPNHLAERADAIRKIIPPGEIRSWPTTSACRSCGHQHDPTNNTSLSARMWATPHQRKSPDIPADEELGVSSGLGREASASHVSRPYLAFPARTPTSRQPSPEFSVRRAITAYFRGVRPDATSPMPTVLISTGSGRPAAPCAGSSVGGSHNSETSASMSKTAPTSANMSALPSATLPTPRRHLQAVRSWRRPFISIRTTLSFVFDRDARNAIQYTDFDSLARCRRWPSPLTVKSAIARSSQRHRPWHLTRSTSDPSCPQYYLQSWFRIYSNPAASVRYSRLGRGRIVRAIISLTVNTCRGVPVGGAARPVHYHEQPFFAFFSAARRSC